MLEALRKFGLEYCDLPTMIDNIAFLLRMYTVNIERTYTQSIPTIYYIITIVTGASYFYVYVISTLWFVFVRCQETRDMAAASVVFSLGACSLTGVAKLFYMHVYKLSICFNPTPEHWSSVQVRYIHHSYGKFSLHNEVYHFSDTIQNIVDEYLACYAVVKPGTRYSANILKTLRNVKRRAVSFWLFLSINAVVYIGIAICLPGRHFTEDLCIIYGLEPMFETPNYQIAFMMMSAGMCFAIPVEIYTSAFLIIFVGYTEAQILALSIEVDNIWHDANQCHQFLEEIIGNKKNASKEKILNDFIQKQLNDIIKKHITGIKCVKQVESIYRSAMTIEFGFLTSGLIAELLGGLENTYAQVPYTLIQIALNCFIGQRLIDASLVLENAIYCCQWEYFNTSNQKTVYLMLMTSQKTLTFSVGGLTVLSFAYLMSVLKSIYSAYTTLRSRV
ncbi:uncharacterized protein [Epargyreus clarus]|uniref:uncharacterized protein n=1 Tax=Epargyreus clarus TaxID=520877 RepID=UPI003C2C1147